MRKSRSLFGFVALCLLFVPVTLFGADMPKDIVDGHLHYLDFIQKTDGFEKLITKMDETGVTHPITFTVNYHYSLTRKAPLHVTNIRRLILYFYSFNAN